MSITSKTKIAAIATAAAFAIAPGSLVAGSYGASAAKDDRVGNYASAGQEVYCGRLDRNIPAQLAEQMDCGGSARPKVANNRISNFFGLRPVKPKVIPTDDDNPVKPTPVSTTPKQPPTETTKVPKWERLNQLGVDEDNFDAQSDTFKNEFSDYKDEHGVEGDWSGFNPSSPES